MFPAQNAAGALLMAPITPFGKPLSQSPLMGSETLPPSATTTGAEKPISAFQWVSVLRATWTWILRPLWYVCFKWPAQLLFVGLAPRSVSRADEERRRDDDEWWAQRQHEELNAAWQRSKRD